MDSARLYLYWLLAKNFSRTRVSTKTAKAYSSNHCLRVNHTTPFMSQIDEHSVFLHVQYHYDSAGGELGDLCVFSVFIRPFASAPSRIDNRERERREDCFQS